MNPARLLFEWAVLLTVAIGGTLWAQSSGLTDRIDNQLLDRATAFTLPDRNADIVIVAIDDRSLAELGAWPWPRETHAKLIDRLTDAGARLIMLDVLFVEPSSSGSDTALAEAMASSGSVYLPHSFTAQANARSGDDPLMPIGELASAAAGVGHVIAEPDKDGVLRRFDLSYATHDDRFAHAAVLVLQDLESGSSSLKTLPNEALIPFHPEAAFPHEPAANVLAGSTVEGFFKDKVVLIGATAPGLGDRYSVATGSVNLMTGIGTQANLLNALLQDALISTTSPFAQGAVAVVLLFLLFMAFWHLPPRYVLLCAVAMVIAVLLVSVALLGLAQIWFAPGAILLAIILSYPLWSWRRLSHVSRYLDREAARLTVDDPSSLPGEGLDYVTRQVDQLRRLIKTVRGSLSFLRKVIEAAPDAILVLDPDGTVEMLNEQAQALFPGWTEGGSRVSFVELLLFSGASQQKDGTELLSADGRTFLIARADLEVKGDNEPSGKIIALRDVSDLRRLDDERKHMLEFLSHDMRTPQVAIVGLSRRSSTGVSDDEVMGRIRVQAERTLKLADDFVQLARLDSPTLSIADGDVGALVEEACDRAYSPAAAKGITIHQDMPDEPCFAQIDASLIARMLDNLIGNAIKYSGTDTQVRVALRGCGQGPLVIEVADEGPGLSPERMVDPFARFGAHATHAGPSAGLGLALVKKVVDVHAGEITWRSAPGEGTAFVITFPDQRCS